MARFVIEDDFHAEQSGEFATEHEALAELRRRAELPWDKEPNQAPCTNLTKLWSHILRDRVRRYPRTVVGAKALKDAGDFGLGGYVVRRCPLMPPTPRLKLLLLRRMRR